MENSKFVYDDPIIVLNGLVTDRNECSLEKKIELLRKKKKISKKENNINIRKIQIKNNKNAKNISNLSLKKEIFSEESNSEIMRFIDLDKSSDLMKDKNKTKNKKKSLNKSLSRYEEFFKSHNCQINTKKKIIVKIREKRQKIKKKK